MFTDTPGFHKPRTPLGHRLNETRRGDGVRGGRGDPRRRRGRRASGGATRTSFEHEVATARALRLCAVNKVDRVAHRRLVPQLAAAAGLGEFDEIVPVSAAPAPASRSSLDLVVARLPEGPPLYPPGQVTDQTLEVRIAEIVRERALELTRQELPHSIAVEVEELEVPDDAAPRGSRR